MGASFRKGVFFGAILAVILQGIIPIVSNSSWKPSCYLEYTKESKGHEDIAINATTTTTIDATTNATTGISVNSSYTFPKEKRSKLMICGHHSVNPINILTKEFKLNEVPWTAPEWDVVYGGYMHCQPRLPNGNPSYNLDGGLNKRLNDEGWANLKPHQMWFPCMGCHWSYCDKVQLCRLIQQYAPNECFLLPKDKDRLEKLMDNNKVWVLKRSAPSLFLHLGTGVQYVKNLAGVQDQISDGTYMVQPYHPPLTTWKNRKFELKVYLAVTSVYPLRLYAHKLMPVILAPVPFVGINSSDKCQHITNVNQNEGCRPDMNMEDRVMLFSEYAQHAGLDEAALTRKVQEMLAFVIEAAQPDIQSHYINQGIHTSGAGCWSFMRADLGISADGHPVLYEINETPSVDGGGKFQQWKNQMHREIFAMIGLDAPPMPANERAAYERSHMAGWIPISKAAQSQKVAQD